MRLGVLCTFLVACHPASDPGSATSSSIVRAGDRVYVANDIDGTVTALDLRGDRIATIPVGGRPWSLSPLGDVVFVADRAGRVFRIEGDAVTATRSLGGDPVAILATPDAVYVALYDDSRVVALDLDLGAEVGTWRPGWDPDRAEVDEGVSPSRGWDPRALALAGHHLVVAHHMNGRISRIDLDAQAVDHSVFLSSEGDDLPYRIETAAIDDTTVFVPHVLWDAGNVLTTDSTSAVLSRLDVETFEEGPRVGLPVAAPIAVSPGAPFVVIGEEGHAAAIDPDTGAAEWVVDLGAPARGVARVDDEVWVHLPLTGDVAIVGDDTARTVAATATTAGHLAGKTVFYEGDVQTCGTCHPDGMSKTVRWFLTDARLDVTVDARIGHRGLVGGAAGYDPDEVRADLASIFAEARGEIPDDAALDDLDAWLHGPTNLPLHGSWLTTAGGDLVDPGIFEPDETCAGCHSAIYAEYQETKHALAGLGDPVFLAVEARARAEAGDGLTTWCAGCHTPAALASGSRSITDGPMPAAQRQGITCLGCHTVVGVRNSEGNNPSVLDPHASADAGYPADGADPGPHRTAMRNDAYGQSGFCARCHNSFTPGSGVVEFQTYQEYLRSPFHTQEHDSELTCVGCHMPLADDGHRSHRFIEPTRGDDPARDLLASAARVEIAWTGDPVPGAPWEVDVTVTNVGAGHALPTGVTNLRGLTLRIEANDEVVRFVRFGKTFADADGEPLLGHEVWRVARVLTDTAIPPAGQRTVRATVDVPNDATEVHVVASLGYRALHPDAVDAILGTDAPDPEPISMAEARATVPIP